MVVIGIVLAVAAVYLIVRLVMINFIRYRNPEVYEWWEEFDNTWKSWIFRFHEEDWEEEPEYEPEAPSVPTAAVETEIRTEARTENTPTAASVEASSSDRTETKPRKQTKHRSNPIRSHHTAVKELYPNLTHPKDVTAQIYTDQVHVMKQLDAWNNIYRLRFKTNNRREHYGLNLEPMIGVSELLLRFSTIETNIQHAMNCNLQQQDFAYYTDLYNRAKLSGTYCAGVMGKLQSLAAMAEDLYTRVNNPSDDLWFSDKHDNQNLETIHTLLQATLQLLAEHEKTLYRMRMALCERIGSTFEREGRAWATAQLHALQKFHSEELPEGDSGAA